MMDGEWFKGSVNDAVNAILNTAGPQAGAIKSDHDSDFTRPELVRTFLQI
jgi:hypothetical protein